MVAATLLWGGTFVAIRDSVAAIPPALLVASRFLCAGLIFAAILLVRRRVPSTADLRGGVVSGLFMVGGFYLQAEGLRTTSAGSSAFLTCAGTLVAPFFAWALLRERPSREVFLGMALALAGSALLSWRADLGFGRAELQTYLGAMSYAMSIVIVARVAPRLDVLALTTAQLLGVTLCLLPFASVRQAAALMVSPATAWRVAYLTLGGSLIAPLLQVGAQRTLPTGRIALLFALEPVFALLFSALLGGERFALQWWMGAALILCAVLVAEWRAAR
jgi:drug/metabolite transporter (DMT)-like permease